MSESASHEVIPAISTTETAPASDLVIDDQGRPEPPLAADEGRTLSSFLDFQRATLHWKCSNLNQAQLQISVAASTMTLGGILKHLSWVEDHWFTGMFLGEPMPELWLGVDWSAEPDWDWTSAADDAPGALFRLWRASVRRSRKVVSSPQDQPDLSALAARVWPDGQQLSLRWILVHMIEEYARHNGHADLIRESIDGDTGE